VRSGTNQVKVGCPEIVSPTWLNGTKAVNLADELASQLPPRVVFVPVSFGLEGFSGGVYFASATGAIQNETLSIKLAMPAE
jgi:hypothetical protein